MSLSIGWKILQDIAKILEDRGIHKDAFNFADMELHGELGFFIMSMKPNQRATGMGDEIPGMPISHYFNNLCIEIIDSTFNCVLIENGEGQDLHSVRVTLNNELSRDQHDQLLEDSMFKIVNIPLSDPQCFDKVANAVMLTIQRIAEAEVHHQYRLELVRQINNLNQQIRATDLKAIRHIIGVPDVPDTGAV